MRQTNLLKLLLAAALAAIWMVPMDVLPVFGQPSHAKVAILTPGVTLTAVHEGLREGLARLGYKEGKSIAFVVDDTKGSTSNLVSRAAKLLTAKPDVLFTVTTLHAMAAKQATSTVPIVFAWVGDPIQAGLIASYASSKNNLTGVSTSAASLSGKRLEVLLEVAPVVRRLLVFVVPDESAGLISLQFLEEAAKKLGVQLVRRVVTNREEIEQALQETPKGSADAIFFISSTLVRANIELLVKKAKKERIPLAVHEDTLVELGALISYGPEPRLSGVQAAAFVDKVLKGTRPSEIVIETPNRLFLAVNATTAREIGLKIPRAVLEKVDRLVE